MTFGFRVTRAWNATIQSAKADMWSYDLATTEHLVRILMTPLAPRTRNKKSPEKEERWSAVKQAGRAGTEEKSSCRMMSY